MKFPSWKKGKSPASKKEENILGKGESTQIKNQSSQTDSSKVTKNAQQPQISIEPQHKTKNDFTKYEENKNYIHKLISKAGLPLVLRSEQNITIQEETKNEVASVLEQNVKLTKEMVQCDTKVINDEEYLLKIANFHYLLGNTQEAIDLYQQVLKRNPTKMTALNNKGVVLDSVGKHDVALECFNKALSSVPENVHVLYNKGISLYKNERYEEALRCFESALKFEANYVSALTFKGHSLYRLGKNIDALASYNKVLRLDQNNVEALYNKACLCSLKGDEYGALTSLERALKLDPSWKTAASEDKDLNGIKDNPHFLELVQSSN